MRNVLIAILMIGSIGVGGETVAIGAGSEPTEIAVAMETAKFKVENMTCATCPIAVKTAMKRVEGVESVEVDFDEKTATVVYDADITTPEEIAAASTAVGYPATVIET